MLAASKVKMSASIKKMNRNTCDISSTKRVKTRKFQVVIVQNNGKEMSQKSVLQVQSCFLLIKPLIFFCCSHCRRLVLHYFIFCLSKL